jgi:hypothetical protein
MISEIQLFTILREKVGEEQARALTEYVEAKVKAEVEASRQSLATREDLANTKVDLIKWMVGFWVSQMAALVGLYLVK